MTDVAEAGLTVAEAGQRLEQDGANALPPPPATPLLRRVGAAVRDPLVLVLLGALVMTVLSRDVADSAIIALVVLVNTTLAVRQEVRADQDARALESLVPRRSRVVRDGAATTVPSADLVRGDLLLLRAGDMVPADCRLLDGVDVAVDESALTGESMPVEKAAVDEGSEAELWSGTAVLRGHGRAVATATGTGSVLGRIATSMTTAVVSTPLQRRMRRLSLQLAAAVAVLSAVVLVIGLAAGRPLETMVLTAVSLAVAAVPESLPAVVTITLALAARRMAARHAVVRRLAAVETLGSVTLLATDKTGTLTEGSMRVADAWTPDGVRPGSLWEAAVLCNDAEPTGATTTGPAGPAHGDPMEVALIAAAAAAGVDARSVRNAWVRVGEEGFDRVRRSMTVTCRRGTESRTVTKGAPEVLLGEVGDPASVRAEAHRTAAELAAAGARIIAVAQTDSGGAEPRTLHLLGLVALNDPTRTTARATVDLCRKAGMQLVIVTGDHPATAAAVARQVGILTEREGAAVTAAAAVLAPEVPAVVARATPQDKLALVRHWQAQGHVVAMTGDGVNDGPALHAAQVGVAMGRRGTEVARQAADVILADDDLGTIAAAVEEGRRVYANIRRFLLYGLSGGASEILAMLVGPLVGLPLPLLAGQLLWVNIVTHSFAGTALGVEPAEIGTMDSRPRHPEQAVVGGGLWWRLALVSVVLTGVGLLAALRAPEVAAQTALMLTLGAGQLGVAWGVRARRAAAPRSGSGRFVLPGAIAGAALLLALGAWWPLLRDLLLTAPVDPLTWATAAAAFPVMAMVTRRLRPQAF